MDYKIVLALGSPCLPMPVNYARILFQSFWIWA